MKLTISLILLGIVQIATGGFYGLLAPIRIEQNIQTDLSRASNTAEERVTKELSPMFAAKWSKDVESHVWNEMKEAESLARSAREGWNSLETTSWILAGAGIFTLIAGFTTWKPEPVGAGQPDKPPVKL